MWNITKEAKQKFADCNTLPIHESDEEWEMVIREAQEEGEDILSSLKEELDEVKDVLVRILPERFIPYVENGTLNQPTLPKDVREDYLDWMREADQEFEQKLDAASNQTDKAVSFLPKAIQEIFEESLHDAVIDRLEREGNTLHLYINLDGGFSSKSYIRLTFENIISEEADEAIQVGQWIVYYELQKTEDGFAFRVLFDCPDSEWTIVMSHMDANYYYRPPHYTALRDEDKLEKTTLSAYLSLLASDQQYWFITPDVICPINQFSENIELENGKITLGQTKIAVTFQDKNHDYDLEEYNPIEFIYTDVYEDPYASQNEPLPKEEIEAAALSDDLELQVRAWNTMYSNPEELADIVNRVLMKIDRTDENEMLLIVYTNHFYSEGILTEAVIEKFKTLIE